MPGVSSRGPVHGVHGVGKVHLKFKPIPPKRGYRVLGLFVYGAFFSLIALSFAWSRPGLRYNYALPVLRRVMLFYEWVKLRRTAASSSAHSISSSTVRGALFDQGYSHASDRLMQMEIYRRTAYGTLSELYGNSTVGSDRFFRTARLQERAADDVNNLNAEQKALLRSYTDGVNSYLNEASFKRSFPMDFDVLHWSTGSNSSSLHPWTVQDSLAVLRLTMYTWSHGWEDEIREDLAATASQMRKSELWTSSQTWSAYVDETGNAILPSLGGAIVAVSGQRSATGHALLAGSVNTMADHQGLWYLNSLSVPGQLEVSGASVPGVPFVMIGRNRHLAWSFVQDVDPSRESELQPAAVEEAMKGGAAECSGEKIVVRGEEDTPLNVICSAAGPVVVEHVAPTVHVALQSVRDTAGVGRATIRTPALSEPLSIDFLQDINSATGTAAFAEGVSKLTAARLRFVYADDQGRVGSVTSGRAIAVDSAVEASAQQEDAVNAGQADVGADGHRDVVIAADTPAAAARIRALLGSPASKITADTLKRVLIDTHSPSALLLRDLLLSLPSDASEVTFAQALVKDFTGELSADSAAATLIEAFRVELMNSLLKPLGAVGNVVTGAAVSPVSRLGRSTVRTEIAWLADNLLSPACDSGVSGNCPSAAWRKRLSGVGAQASVEAALREAVTWCRASFGQQPSSAWHWGAVHSAQYDHPNPSMFRVLDEVLSRGPGRMSGGLDSLHRAGYGAQGGLVSAETLHHGEGQPVTSLRMVVDMADGLCYDAMLPHGQSNRPLDSLLSSADRFQRWSSPDPAVAYERLCLPHTPPRAGSAAEGNKEEL